MSKKTTSAVLDTILDHIADNANEIVACAGEPLDYNATQTNPAGNGNRLAGGSLTTGAGNGDYTIASNGNDRELTIAQQTGITIDDGGDVDHIALVDTNNLTLIYVTTCPSQALTATNNLTVESWKITNPQPV